MRNMVKGLQKVFKTVVKDISQVLPTLGESGSEVSYFILDHRNFSEVTKFSDDKNKPWLKAIEKDINNLIKNQTFFVQYPEKGEPVTPCIQSKGSLDKLKLRILVREDLKKRN